MEQPDAGHSDHRRVRPARTGTVRAPRRGGRTRPRLPGVGFFYVTGHGIAPDITEGVFAAAHRLFALPPARKQERAIIRSPHNRGYVGIGAERLDETGTPDCKEAFNISLDLPPNDPRALLGGAFRRCQSRRVGGGAAKLRHPRRRAALRADHQRRLSTAAAERHPGSSAARRDRRDIGILTLLYRFDLRNP